MRVLIVAALLLTACSSAGPAGVAVDAAGVQKERLLVLQDERVFAIAPLPNQELEVVTTRGHRTVNRSGDIIESTDFQAKDELFPATAHAGYDWDAHALLLFREDGSVQGRVPLQQSGRFAISADGQAIVQDGSFRAIRIHDADGALVRRVDIGEYVTDLETTEDRLIVYTYPDANRNGVFRTLTTDGTVLARWTVAPPVGDSSVVATGNGPAILTVTETGFVMYSPEGQELRRFPAAVGRYSAARGVRLAGDKWVLVATGDGYLPQSAITVFEGERQVYSETVDGRSYAVAASGEDSFLVGIENAIWKYGLPRPHRVP
jgi:hypothetical protein